MNPADCCLTLVFPPSLEDAVLRHLLEHPEWVSGCSVFPAEGIGQHVHGHDARELVRGRARQTAVQIVMNGEDARELVALLRDALRNADVAWWISPVTGFGRFA
jgi:hypothetical protein